MNLRFSFSEDIGKKHLYKVKFKVCVTQDVANKKFVKIHYQNDLPACVCMRHNDKFNGGCGRILVAQGETALTVENAKVRHPRKLNRSIDSPITDLCETPPVLSLKHAICRSLK